MKHHSDAKSGSFQEKSDLHFEKVRKGEAPKETGNHDKNMKGP